MLAPFINAQPSLCDPPIAGPEAGNYLDETMHAIRQEGGAWICSGTAGAKTLFSLLESGSCEDPWQDTFGIGQMRNVFALILVVSMALGGVYMFGQFLQSPRIIAMAKDEFFQLLFMGVIVTGLYINLQGGNMWYAFRIDTNDIDDPTAVSIYGNSPTIIDAAMAYSRLMVYKITSDLSSLAIFNAIIHTLYTSTLWVGVNFRAMWTFNMGPVLKPLIDILGTAMQFLGVAIGEWIVHIIMLCLIKKWTWGVFIPLGMLLHIFPHTRSAGIALISLMFALSLIYPLMFVANYEIYRITSSTLLDNEYLVKEFFDNSGLKGIGLLALVMVFMMAGVLMPLFVGSGLTLSFELIRNAVYYVMVISLLLPFINIFITLTSARELARSLGGNINFLSFVKLI